MTVLANNAQRRGASSEAATRTARRNAVPPADDNRPVSPTRRSWSQYSNLRDCPKRWWLEKVRHAKRRPGVWLSAGTAVHENVADYLTAKAANGN